jgi:Domain of unknown function (DUF5658)
MTLDCGGDRRGRMDRRTQPTAPLDSLRLGGRRTWPRREEERQGAYFVDRFDVMTLAMIVSLLALTIVDGVLTIELLDTNSEEVNPFMAHLLTRGHNAFFLGKYLLTAMGLPFIVLFKYYPMFGTRFRVGFLIPVFVGLYLALVFYQWRLLDIGRGALQPVGSILSSRYMRMSERSRVVTATAGTETAAQIASAVIAYRWSARAVAVPQYSGTGRGQSRDWAAG